MNSQSHFPTPALDLAVRVGCELIYDVTAEAPALVNLKPRHGALQSIRQESFHFQPELTATEFEDDHFNIVYRLILKPGRNVLSYDGIVMVPSLREDFAVSVPELDALTQLYPYNGTPLYSALGQTYEDATAAYDPDSINAVVLLSDGVNEVQANLDDADKVQVVDVSQLLLDSLKP